MTDWSEENPTIELVKTMLTVPEVAQMLGYDVDEGDKIVSPYNPSERTPSCHLYDDHFYCYSTGQGGDIIDLVIAHDPELTFSQALRKLWHRSLRAGREPGDVEAEPPRMLHDFTDDLTGEPINLFGYPTATYGVLRTGDGQDLIPHRSDGTCYGVKVRYPGGQKSSWPGSQFSHRLYDPYGWPTSPLLEVAAAVICEGESDTWAMLSVGLPVDVFGLPSGAGTWKDHWLTDLRPYTRVLICMDNDRAGQQARDKLISKIGWDKAVPLPVPQLYNDARAAIEAGWRPTL